MRIQQLEEELARYKAQIKRYNKDLGLGTDEYFVSVTPEARVTRLHIGAS